MQTNDINEVSLNGLVLGYHMVEVKGIRIHHLDMLTDGNASELSTSFNRVSITAPAGGHPDPVTDALLNRLASGQRGVFARIEGRLCQSPDGNAFVSAVNASESDSETFSNEFRYSGTTGIPVPAAGKTFSVPVTSILDGHPTVISALLPAKGTVVDKIKKGRLSPGEKIHLEGQLVGMELNGPNGKRYFHCMMLAETARTLDKKKTAAKGVNIG